MSKKHSRPEGVRAFPEKIVLEVKNGVQPSPASPVRIFIGSETAQAKAERILVWSIERFRDPGRIYEIFLMKELKGFNRSKWLTGFTNYRFAIPEFAGKAGRAIYNDVDQIYLADPGELFDHPMDSHGFLSIARNDSSVMIMDCQKMAAVWSLESAKFEKKNKLLQRALEVNSLWGQLESEWNARDEEYHPGRSKVLHFTALHTQPWQPFPNEFVYQKSPVGHVWFDLEQSADQEGFQLFSPSHPSSRFTELANGGWKPWDLLYVDGKAPSDSMALDLLEEAGRMLNARTLLSYHLRPSADSFTQSCTKAKVELPFTTTHINLFNHQQDGLGDQQFDIVFGSERLHLIPEEDIPWILEEMFHRARSMVFLRLTDFPDVNPVSSKIQSGAFKKNFSWWLTHCESIGSRYPSIHWKCVFQTRNAKGVAQQFVRWGGRWIGSPPRIWILSDGKVGHTTQSEILAKALGWPYEIKQLRFHGWHKFQKLLWGVLPPNTMGFDETHSSPIKPPWPDLLISTGWRPAPIARWIREQSQGTTRIVQLGRKGGCSADLFDVVVTPSYYGFPPHPNRIETAAPLNELSQESLEEVGRRWPHLFNQAPRPRIVFVVGGPTSRFKFTPEMAREMGTTLKNLAAKCHGKIFAVTSPRTGKDLSLALESALIPDHVIHKWEPNQTNNPYLAYLAGADVIIVTGESESMLTEAASLGKPVYIIPLPEHSPSWKVRFSERIVRQAHAQPLNRRGTTRPQQGLEHLCARLIRAGLVQPRRNLSLLHDVLFQKGIAHPFGEPIENGVRPRLRETETVAQKVKTSLGIVDQV